MTTLVAGLALLALLATAYRHPRGRVEGAVAIVAAAAVIATGVLTTDEIGEELGHLGPVVLFLVTILVVADVCARAGLFVAAAHRVRRLGRGRPIPIFTGVFVLAALVTTVLSLDATVVLLTPVVLVAAGSMALARPGAFACLRMANSASLLLPVSNLTNLLAMRGLDLSFGQFATRMAPVLAAVLVVEYVGLRLLFRRDLRDDPTPVEPATAPADAVPVDGAPVEKAAPPVPLVPLVVVLIMLAGFGVLSTRGVEPFWVSGTAAIVLTAWAVTRRLARPIHLVHAAHPTFALFVLALGVVVAALAGGPAGRLVADLLPDDTSYPSLLAIAVVATVLANLLTNLSAALLLVPLLIPLGPTAILAALVGLNVGSGLSYTGSLANLLWRRTLRRYGATIRFGEFHRVSLTITPVALVVGVSALALVG